MKAQARYYDNDGREIRERDFVSIHGAPAERVYRTSDGELGVDATNKVWLADGRAVACEYGIYALTDYDMLDIVKIEN